jgi:uncharacterized protein YegL
MKRRSRDISVFSISAIDLFACAMGAFVILALILLENKKDADTAPPTDPTAPLQQQVDRLQKALAKAQAKVDQLQEAASNAEKALQAQQAEAERNRQLAFLGIVTEAKSFVILLDMSGSMREYEGITRKTLGELLGQMNDNYRCQIIGFQGHAETNIKPTLRAWQTPNNLASMTKQNTAAALTFADGLIAQFRGGTPTYLALETALRYDSEAIFLMTDGEPNDIEDWQEIVRRITRLNGGRKKIYSIAIGEYRKAPELGLFLEELARKNSGKFLGVSD